MQHTTSFVNDILGTEALYRVVKRNFQVVKIVNFGHMNEFGVQNSSPTCEHNLFILIQSKKMFVKYLVMLQSSKKLKGQICHVPTVVKLLNFPGQCNLFQIEFHNDFGISVILTYDI